VNCALGEYCAAHTLGDGGSSCRAASIGSPCGDWSECLKGQYCASGGKCAAQRAEGEPCDYSVYGPCTGALLCELVNDAGVCARMADLGAPCSTDGECLMPFDCIAGTCARVGHSGQPCAGGAFCFDGFCQRDAGSTGRGLCGAYHGAGEPCASHHDCASDACEQGVCQPACP